MVKRIGRQLHLIELMDKPGPSTAEIDIVAIPATMQAAVYRGVNDVRLETVPVPKIAPARCLSASTPAASAAPTSRRFPPARTRRRASSDTKPLASSPQSARTLRNYRPGDRVMVFHHIPCRECFYCREQDFRPVRHLQESRLHRWIRALRRGFRRIRPRHGLDRRARYRPHSR